MLATFIAKIKVWYLESSRGLHPQTTFFPTSLTMHVIYIRLRVAIKFNLSWLYTKVLYFVIFCRGMSVVKEKSV